MLSISLFVASALAAFVSATPVSRATAAQTLTGAFDCATAGAYTLCQNQWGARKCLVNIFDE